VLLIVYTAAYPEEHQECDIAEEKKGTRERRGRKQLGKLLDSFTSRLRLVYVSFTSFLRKRVCREGGGRVKEEGYKRKVPTDSEDFRLPQGK